MKKEDRLVFIGLTNSVVMPAEGEAKKKWLHDMVSNVFNMIVFGCYCIGFEESFCNKELELVW